MTHAATVRHGNTARAQPRALVASWFCFCLLAGCSSASRDAVPLTIISPHRDEIREETARAFLDWFQIRTDERARAAAGSLDAWTAQPNAATAAAATSALDALLADWTENDTTALRDAWREWQVQPQQVEPLRKALSKWQNQPHPVAIVWQDVGGGTSQIVRYLRSQFEATPDGVGIDVLFGGGTDVFIRLAEERLLAPLTMPEAIMKRIHPQLNGVPMYDPAGRWFGPVLSSFGILCNLKVLERIGEPQPRRWADLGRPGLESWVSAGDPRLTGSVHMVYEIILQGPAGWEGGLRLLLRMGANTHTFIRDSGTLTRTVIAGEVAAAGNLDANALSAVGRNPDMMAFNLPPGETIINPDAIAVLKGAPQLPLARAFVEFTLSDAGQKVFFLQPGQPGGPRRYPLCRLSVVEALYAEYPPAQRSTGTTNPFAVGNTIVYDSRLGVRRWDALNDLFSAWIIDAHPHLRAAWRAVLRSELPEKERQKLEEELFQPPCSEAELAAYAKAITDGSPRVRTEQITRWGEEARQRYRRIERAAR